MINLIATDLRPRFIGSGGNTAVAGRRRRSGRGVGHREPLLLVVKHRLVVEIGKLVPRLVPGLVVFRRVRVVLDDMRDRRLVDAVQTLVPFSQLTVAPASTDAARH